LEIAQAVSGGETTVNRDRGKAALPVVVFLDGTRVIAGAFVESVSKSRFHHLTSRQATGLPVPQTGEERLHELRPGMIPLKRLELPFQVRPEEDALVAGDEGSDLVKGELLCILRERNPHGPAELLG